MNVASITPVLVRPDPVAPLEIRRVVDVEVRKPRDNRDRVGTHRRVDMDDNACYRAMAVG